MSSQSEAEAAIAGLNGKTFTDKTMVVNESHPRTDNMGGGSYGNRRGGSCIFLHPLSRHTSGQCNRLAKEDTMNIYVGNLSLEMTEDELRKEFTEFGEVVSVTIMNHKYIGSGQPRGYGYVEMPSKSEGTTAIANMAGKKLKNRVVYAVQALPLSNKDGAATSRTRNNNLSNIEEEKEKYQMI
jgi:RNA recognition motif-containing protein